VECLTKKRKNMFSNKKLTESRHERSPLFKLTVQRLFISLVVGSCGFAALASDGLKDDEERVSIGRF
jgi:hypothetical protein